MKKTSYYKIYTKFSIFKIFKIINDIIFNEMKFKLIKKQMSNIIHDIMMKKELILMNTNLLIQTFSLP